MINNASPNDASILNNAQTLLAQNRINEACWLLQAALDEMGNNSSVWTALGVALRAAAKFDEAADAFERALALNPKRADTQAYLGMIRLAQNRQEDGWALYHARWQAPHWTEPLRYGADSLWQGNVRAGFRLLLWGEQGYGDVIQFARYAPWLLKQLKAQGAILVFEAPDPLCGLLRCSWPFMNIKAKGDVRGHFDAHLPLMDLPMLWGGCGEQGRLPYKPYFRSYLSALPDLIAPWRGKLLLPPSLNQKVLRIGIQWQGRRTHPDDQWRSMPTELLNPLFEVPGVQWVSLQKNASGHPHWLPEDLESCMDFADTARVVSGLDLVISVDSAMAHLAGALGRPVWLLLPRVTDWRWGMSGDSSPWYDTMRLFRHNSNESWAHVIQRVVLALKDACLKSEMF